MAASPVKTDHVVPKADRRLGISVGPGKDGNYGEAFMTAKSAGMQSVTLSFDWSQLEPKASQYDDTFPTVANVFYPAQNCSIDLILRPINTNHIEMPPDLQGKSFDSPEVIDRFERLIDHLYAKMPNVKIDTLAIGNEVDGELGANDALWRQYRTFYRAVSAHARKVRPGVQVGVVGTYNGMVGAPAEQFKTLNKTSDVILVTYYPLHADFTVESAASPLHDFDQMTSLYRGRPIVMTEVGYPSAAACGSSEAAQASFIRSVFHAWDAHVHQIRAITFSWLTDMSPGSTATYSHYYGVSTLAFGEFLRTLGLRTYSGEDKTSFLVLKAEAKKRGW